MVSRKSIKCTLLPSYKSDIQCVFFNQIVENNVEKPPEGSCIEDFGPFEIGIQELIRW